MSEIKELWNKAKHPSNAAVIWLLLAFVSLILDIWTNNFNTQFWACLIISNIWIAKITK